MKKLTEKIQMIEEIGTLVLRRIVIDWNSKSIGVLLGGGDVDENGIFKQTKLMPLEFDKNRSLAPDEKSFDEIVGDILGIPSETLKENILNYGEAHFKKLEKKGK